MNGQQFIDHLKHEAYNDIENVNQYQEDLHGWMCDSFRYVFENMIKDVYVRVKRPLVIIEVGTWKGLSAITMASIAKSLGIPITIICIDTWLGAPEFWTWGLHDPTRGTSLVRKNGFPHVYYTFLRNVVHNNHTDVIVPFPISGNEAVNVLRYYNIVGDIIYIDASHEYEAVKNDLVKYWSVLQSGGYLFGDDFTDFWMGVKNAVIEYSSKINTPYNINDVVWHMKKQ